MDWLLSTRNPLPSKSFVSIIHNKSKQITWSLLWTKASTTIQVFMVDTIDFEVKKLSRNMRFRWRIFTFTRFNTWNKSPSKGTALLTPALFFSKLLIYGYWLDSISSIKIRDKVNATWIYSRIMDIWFEQGAFPQIPYLDIIKNTLLNW